jgi:hypothetical protein
MFFVGRANAFCFEIPARSYPILKLIAAFMDKTMSLQLHFSTPFTSYVLFGRSCLAIVALDVTSLFLPLSAKRAICTRQEGLAA